MNLRRSSSVMFYPLLLLGCVTPQPDLVGQESSIDMSRRDVAPVVLDGRGIGWADLRPLLAEAGGAAVLDEVVLDRLLEGELDRAGLDVSGAMIEAERDRFTEGLGSTADSTALVLDRVRRRRGLGPARFERLLWRNAALRTLSAGTVEVSDEEIRLAHEIRTGEQYEVRVIITATETEASAVRGRLASLDAVTSDAFAREAVAASIDPSAPRGGLLEPISAADPAWPASVRAALPSLTVGGLSDVIALDRGFGLLYLESRLQAREVPLEAVFASLEDGLRRRKERVASERLARQLLAGADVTVFDPSLRWSHSSGIKE